MVVAGLFPVAIPASNQTELTAEFVDVPQLHDGVNHFTLRVAFSEDVGVTLAIFRDTSLAVTGGVATRARRVNGRRDLYEVTVQPNGDDDVTVTLPATPDCSATGAVCTRGAANRRPLSNSPSATVAGPASATGADTDATLSELRLSDVRIGDFLPATIDYVADADSAVHTTTVTATATHSGAVVVVAPADADAVAAGHQVLLDVGRNEISATVTAEDGVASTTYTVVVYRAAASATLATLPETMTEASVMAFIEEHGISSVAGFVDALPPLHKRHFVSLFESSSPVANFISPSHPRIVSWGADARFIATWTTNPDAPSRDMVEFLQPVAEEGRWIAGVVDFSGSAPELRHPESCASCHSDINRPLWGAYDVWAGTEKEDNTSNPPRQPVRDLFETMEATTNPRVTPLEQADYESFPRLIPLADRPRGEPNWEFGSALLRRHAEVLFDRLRAEEDYDAFVESLACASWGTGEVIRRVGRDRYDPRRLSSSLDPIQGENSLTGNDFLYGVRLAEAIEFLTFHDLWQRNESIARRYREQANDLTGTSYTGEFETRRLFPLGSATEEDEMLAAYREFFTLRGQASIDERVGRRIDPRFGALFIPVQLYHYGPIVCELLGSPPEAPAGFDPSAPAIGGFTLVNAEGGSPDPDVGTIDAGAVVDVSGLAAESVAIRADVGADTLVGSVRLELLGPKTASATDNAAPYALFGEDGAGDYGGATLPNGDYRIIATHHAERDGRDAAGAPLALDFSVTGGAAAPPSPVTGFVLVDAETDTDIGPIGAGATLDLSSTASSLFSIRAEVRADADVGSIRLALRGPVSVTDAEALAPFALYGDDGAGDYRGGALPNGAYAITATPFPEPGLWGEAGTTAMVTFTVMGGSDANAPVRAAVPEVSVAAGGPVTEGAAASYTLTRTGATTDALTVTVSVTETAAMLAANPPTTVTFGPGQSNATLSVPTDDDAVEEPASTVTVGLVAGAGYTVALGSGSAEVTVEDNDDTELTAQFVGMPASHDGQTAFTFELHFSENLEGFSYLTLRDEAFAVTGGAVTGARRLSPPSNQRWEITVAPSSDADVVVVLPATGDCGGAGAICTGGRPLSNRLEATVAGPAADAEVSIAAGTSPVTEGTAASYTLTRTGATTDALTVTVGVAETQAMLAANPPTAVTFGAGDSSVTLTVATDDDAVVEPASVVTATVAAESGYTVASGSGSAAVTAEDNDEAEFAVTAAPEEIAEGESATLTVSVSNGVTFAADQAIGLTLSGTATQASDYTVSDTTLTLPAGASSVEATVAAVDDAEEEDAETVVIAATHGGAEAGTAVLTIAANDAPEAGPEVSIAAGGSVTEGAAASFTLTRTEPTTDVLTVTVSVTETEAMLAAGAPTSATFGSGESSATLTVATDDDAVPEPASEVTVTVVAGDDYTVAAGDGSAQVTVEDNDASADAALAGLTLSGIALGFVSDVESYLVLVDHDVTETTVTATPSDSGATVEIADADGSTAGTERTVALAVGENVITVTVTAADGVTARTYTVTVHRAEAADEPEGFPLTANRNARGVWSDGTLLWAADERRRLYAYQLAGGARVPDRDITVLELTTPMGVWSDGTTIWVVDQTDATVRAYDLASGARQAARDIAASANNSPTGIWSDGATLWVVEWFDAKFYAYGLVDGARRPEKDISAPAYELSRSGMWSDGQTLWVAEWPGQVLAYRVSDGAELPELRIDTSAVGNDYPQGLWSDGRTLWITEAYGGPVHVHALPEAGASTTATASPDLAAAFPDEGLRDVVVAALDGGDREVVTLADLAALTELDARGAEVTNLWGLEYAARLARLDLGGSAVSDLRPLAGLPALVSLGLDRTGLADLWPLAGLAGLTELSLRGNAIADLRPLAALTRLEQLDLGDNRIADLRPLSALTRLTALRADGNRIEDLWPLSALTGLEQLDVGDNRITQLHPLSGLTRLHMLRVPRNTIADAYPLSLLPRLRWVDLRANRITDASPLALLPGPVHVDAGHNRILNFSALHGRPEILVTGRNAQQ